MNKLGFSCLASTAAQISMQIPQLSSKVPSRSLDRSLTEAILSNLKLISEKLIMEQSLVETNLEMENSRSKTDDIKANLKRDAKLWERLDYKLFSTKELCDQFTGTMRHLTLKGGVKDTFKDNISASSACSDSLQFPFDDISTKLESTEERIKKSLRSTEALTFLPAARLSFEMSPRSLDDSLTEAVLLNRKLISDKLPKEQASVETYLEMEILRHESEELKANLKQDGKLFEKLDYKFSSIKALCDQFTETMCPLINQFREAEQVKNVLKDSFSASSGWSDNVQLPLDGLSIKLESTEDRMRQTEVQREIHLKGGICQELRVAWENQHKGRSNELDEHSLVVSDHVSQLPRICACLTTHTVISVARHTAGAVVCVDSQGTHPMNHIPSPHTFEKWEKLGDNTWVFKSGNGNILLQLFFLLRVHESEYGVTWFATKANEIIHECGFLEVELVFIGYDPGDPVCKVLRWFDGGLEDDCMTGCVAGSGRGSWSRVDFNYDMSFDVARRKVITSTNHAILNRYDCGRTRYVINITLIDNNPTIGIQELDDEEERYQPPDQGRA